MTDYFSKLKTHFKKLWHDEDGIAAVEFAILFPILLLIFVFVVDLGHYLRTDRQLTNAASLVGDRISQMPNNAGIVPTAIVDAGELVNFAQVISATLPRQNQQNIEVRIEIFTRDVRQETTGQIRVHEYRRSLVRLRNFNDNGPQDIGVNLTQTPAATVSSNNTNAYANDPATLLNANFGNSELSEELQTDALQGNGTIRDYIRVQVQTTYQSPFGKVFDIDTPIFEEYITVPRLVNFVTLTNDAGYSIIQ